VEQPTDEELVRRAAQGDHGSFRSLVDRHGKRLCALAVSLCGNATDAEDVVQESLAGAYRSLKTFQGRASVSTWLMRIVFRQASRFRKRRPMRMASLDEFAEDDHSGPAAVDSNTPAHVDRKLDIQALLRHLSVDHREVIVLRELQGLSYEEIATVLEVPRGTVESRLSRARTELKEVLKDYLT
jgi:RNA polymerase sigma-70 factor, ECF subfamily